MVMIHDVQAHMLPNECGDSGHADDVVVRAAAAARYLRHAKSTYMASYIFKVLDL